jgi:hypothetical protein
MQSREEPTAAVKNHPSQGLAELDARPMPAIELSGKKIEKSRFQERSCPPPNARFRLGARRSRSPVALSYTLTYIPVARVTHLLSAPCNEEMSAQSDGSTMLCRAILEGRFEQAI